MKRDMKLIFEILKYVRKHANSCELLIVPNNEELRSRYHTPNHAIHYHVELCVQAGFLSVEETGVDAPGTRISEYGIIDLTWEGHEFLENRPGKKRSRRQMQAHQAGGRR